MYLLSVGCQAVMVVTSFLVLLITLRFCFPCPWSVFSKGFSHQLFCIVLFLDLNEAVPETERLDSKALKTRAQLSVKNRRQRPTRTRLYDSVSSTDGEDSLERKVGALDSFQTCAGLFHYSYSLLKIMVLLQPESVPQLETTGIAPVFVS